MIVVEIHRTIFSFWTSDAILRKARLPQIDELHARHSLECRENGDHAPLLFDVHLAGDSE